MLVIALASSAQGATFGFQIEFVHQSPLSPAESAAISVGQALWESLITGYQDTLTSNTLLIVSEVVSMDGPGGVLGTGYPAAAKFGAEENFLYASAGFLTLDVDDTETLANWGLLDDLVAHELGHVIGFGTLWSSAAAGVSGFQELYQPGSGRYTGWHALHSYRRDYDASAEFVPVELDGGPGTAELHWNEDELGDDLMTGILNGPTFVSSVTRGGLIDLGYTVVPEPSSPLALMLSVPVASCRPKRNRSGNVREAFFVS